MRGVFITGTSTGVGKTYIAALLAQALTEKNIRVIPRKPVESGC
ncbi:MAG: AAA family ATPase, partial [Gammaproteobacteria bacterium]